MAFMEPQAQYLTQDEAHEYVELDECSDESHEACTHEEGWYSRLSASGYLDCTDWSGPYETEKEALDYIQELFEVDASGNEVVS